ncbi:MAG: VOC family protein [Hormoscilla sp. GM102CHS1]|nr:VOC family protein [Hormoscilla sp. GM102CHS1]
MAQNQPPTPTSPDVLHLKRPCLMVADLERALLIYRDILGFRLDYVGDASSNSYLYKAFQFPQEAQLKFAALSTEYEPRTLALTEFKGIQLPTPTPPYRAATVMRVPDIASTIQKIRDRGLEAIEPSFFTVPPNLSFTEQAFCDYDGHLIVLYEVKQSDNLTPSGV